MKRILSTLLALALAWPVVAQEAPSPEKRFYVGTNLLSPLAGTNLKSTVANVLLPLASNLEYGATLTAGYFQAAHWFEARLTAGRSNPYNFIPQVQLGYNLFLLDHLKGNGSRFYVGTFARWWDYRNTLTETQLNNLSLNLATGWNWNRGRFFFDLRLNQPLLLFSHFKGVGTSGSAFELNTSPMPKFSPILPFLSANVGITF